MHFEILVEDSSGKTALEVLVLKILGDRHTFRVLSYKGIGRIPPDLKATSKPRQRILLDQLPRLLRGYGKSLRPGAEAVVIVCDLDDRCLRSFRRELFGVLELCDPRPETRFCFAIEEGEAWLLGDLAAVRRAYPKARSAPLEAYAQDSVCGTWEVLAYALYPGGRQKLIDGGWQAVGAEKARWASKIAPMIEIERNRSASFQYFCRKLRELGGHE